MELWNRSWLHYSSWLVELFPFYSLGLRTYEILYANLSKNICVVFIYVWKWECIEDRPRWWLPIKKKIIGMSMEQRDSENKRKLRYLPKVRKHICCGAENRLPPNSLASVLYNTSLWSIFPISPWRIVDEPLSYNKCESQCLGWLLEFTSILAVSFSIHSQN